MCVLIIYVHFIIAFFLKCTYFTSQVSFPSSLIRNDRNSSVKNTFLIFYIKEYVMEVITCNGLNYHEKSII